ncbi:MAG: carboxylating nicotinate-nucleotide diphosphorylase [Caldilineales bacterium]|nr:carboxylating nicotinate-nucleotide diphosphorylase [Caldilineales bacterium]
MNDWPLSPEQTFEVDDIILRALFEDIGDGDVTSLHTIPDDAVHEGHFLAKAEGIVAGLAVAERVFSHLDDDCRFRYLAADGDRVKPGEWLAEMRGSGRAILSGERLALNLMQRMSGIATATRRLVDAVAGTKAIILDTRKTAPNLRALDKWAVRLGGGQNHRWGLYDMALIKDNHIAAVGGITAAVERVRAGDARGRAIEVEVTDLAGLQEALQLSVDRIMLDNMSLDEMRAAVALTAERVPLEASGNVSLATVADIAATGVDFISSGALTHSVIALDISLELHPD